VAGPQPFREIYWHCLEGEPPGDIGCWGLDCLDSHCDAVPEELSQELSLPIPNVSKELDGVRGSRVDALNSCVYQTKRKIVSYLSRHFRIEPSKPSNYVLTSSGPHREIAVYGILSGILLACLVLLWHLIWHLIQLIFWHAVWLSIWHRVWQPVWHSNRAFYLTSGLAFYLATVLTIYLQ